AVAVVPKALCQAHRRMPKRYAQLSITVIVRPTSVHPNPHFLQPGKEAIMGDRPPCLQQATRINATDVQRNPCSSPLLGQGEISTEPAPTRLLRTRI
ncbi:hypothetical protein M1N82_02050, partial [Dehalococcoidia bacterium]|nr:hypothetical protein [Dehalococcoidia bacterium]